MFHSFPLAIIYYAGLEVSPASIAELALHEPYEPGGLAWYRCMRNWTEADRVLWIVTKRRGSNSGSPAVDARVELTRPRDRGRRGCVVPGDEDLQPTGNAHRRALRVVAANGP
jgi:hypothetical protein